MLSGRDANPIFFDKKIKIGRSEHSLTPHSLRPITSHLCLTPPTPLNVDVLCVSITLLEDSSVYK